MKPALPPFPRLSEPVAAALLGCIVLAYVAHCWLFIGQINDDAFITFRYSRNLAAGVGPYYNPGEHVEGYTNFLQMVLLAPVIAIGGETAALPVAKALGLLGGAAALVLVYATAQVLARGEAAAGTAQAAGLLGAALSAASPGFAQNSTTGLETTLFAALIGAGVCLGIRTVGDRRWHGAGVAFGAALLTRPEGAAVFASFWCVAAVSVLRPTLKRMRATAPRGVGLAAAIVREPLVIDALTVAGVFLAHLAFRFLAYDGEWLPNTYFAKVGGYWKVSPVAYLRAGLLAPLLGPVGVVAALAGLALARPAWGRTLAAASIPATGAALLFFAGTDWMPGHRLTMPYLPLAALVVASGWVGLANAIPARWRWRSWVASGAIVALVFVAFLSQSKERALLRNWVRVRAEGYVTGHQALAAWLRRNAAPGSSVALMDIGLVGYLCPDLRILDVTGLTDRHIAKSPGVFLRKEYDPAYVFDRRPDFIVLVLKAPGDSSRPPPPDTAWRCWSSVEERLAQAREFARYTRRDPQPPADDWKGILAWKFGAERVFEHRHPGLYYLLAVFRRTG